MSCTGWKKGKLLLWRYLWDFNPRWIAIRERDRLPCLAHGFKMHLDGFPHCLQQFLACVAYGHATRQVRYVRRQISFCLLDDDKVPHNCLLAGLHDRGLGKPACWNMLSRVLGAKSLLGWPAMVTDPGFVGWR